MASNFPSFDTLKAEIGSRTTCFELIRFHVVVFHFTILPPRSTKVKIHVTVLFLVKLSIYKELNDIKKLRVKLVKECYTSHCSHIEKLIILAI